MRIFMPVRSLKRLKTPILYTLLVIILLHVLPDLQLQRRAGDGQPHQGRRRSPDFRARETRAPVALAREAPKARGAPAPANHNNITKVIILAYYRGGSTYMGQILNQNPSVFYWYEPFYNFTKQYKKDHNAFYPRNGADVYVQSDFVFRPLIPEAEKKLVHMTLDLLNCDLEKLPLGILQHTFVADYHDMASGHHLKPYRTCMKYKQYRKADSNQTKHAFKIERARYQLINYESCVPLLQKSCDSLRVRGFKTIRMTLSQIERVLHLDPNVKVIYSTRDPRGMASSRHTISSVSGKTWTLRDTIREACVRTRNDIDTLEELRPKFPRNILRTSFERILADPGGEVDRVMTFLGLEKGEEMRRWIDRQLMNADKGNEVVQKWKKQEDQTWWDVKECDGLFVDS